MLAPSPGFLETEEPPDEGQRAPDSPSQGEVWSPNPAAKSNPSSRPTSRVRSTPVWQAALRAARGLYE